MILHFDADAFFASVEQAADKKLRGRPVAVGGERRGVIASASYEARRMGIHAPMPTVRARKLCPSLVVLPCDFDLYERFSRLMFSYAYDFTPIVEQASIDECYLDLHGAAKKMRAGDAAVKIQQAIAQSLKLSVSVGVGGNKLVSHIASKLRKPHCFIEVSPGHEQGFLWPLENKWLPSVGPQLSATLNTAGLRTVGHVAATPVQELALLMGKGAPDLHGYAMGHDPRPVVCEAAEAKSYGEQETFNEDTTDEVFITARLRTMADTLMRRVRSDGKSIRCVTLRLRYNDMDEVQRSATLDEPSALENDVYPCLTSLLKRAWERRVSLRLVGLRFSKVYEANLLAMLPLERDDVARAHWQKLASVVDTLKHERFNIMRGHELWLKQHNDAPRELLPKPQVIADAGAQVTHRVLRERPANGPLMVSSARKKTGMVPALNVRSCFSFQDSALTLADIIEVASSYEVPAVALTDPNLHAAVPFFQAASKAGIKPILGAELHCGAERMLAYVQNTQGYRNLCRLLSDKITPEKMLSHRDGLLLVRPESDALALPEIRYRSAADRQFFAVLQSMKTLTLLNERHPQKRRGDYAFHAPAVWYERYSASALQATRDIAEQCEFSFDFKTLRFPRYTLASDTNTR